MKTLSLSAILLLSAVLAEANWFLNQEQQAAENYNQGHYEEAAKGFEDPYRRGIAYYRTGDYQAASKDFSQVEREEVKLEARYNLGNSRYKLEDYQGAIEAYEQVLESDPGHTDARHNLALAREKLAQRLKDEEEEKEEEQESETEEKESESNEEQQEQEQQQSG
ncbi:MAG: tetratricopeptide repeat protein, partial [Candidatus Thiodiazotropha endolucinida]|nr:tetratricopeptide repeat protein [Candidatus Thiodiazotropha taylori]MCW4235679.1 tetratricopeptide repeat protein [Candidatus Thiodiazotropha endolucinida]